MELLRIASLLKPSILPHFGVLLLFLRALCLCHDFSFVEEIVSIFHEIDLLEEELRLLGTEAFLVEDFRC